MKKIAGENLCSWQIEWETAAYRLMSSVVALIHSFCWITRSATAKQSWHHRIEIAHKERLAIIIITTCSGATQPMLSSALQPTVYTLQFKQVKKTSKFCIRSCNSTWTVSKACHTRKRYVKGLIVMNFRARSWGKGRCWRGWRLEKGRQKIEGQLLQFGGGVIQACAGIVHFESYCYSLHLLRTIRTPTLNALVRSVLCSMTLLPIWRQLQLLKLAIRTTTPCRWPTSEENEIDIENVYSQAIMVASRRLLTREFTSSLLPHLPHLLQPVPFSTMTSWRWKHRLTHI